MPHLSHTDVSILGLEELVSLLILQAAELKIDAERLRAYAWYRARALRRVARLNVDRDHTIKETARIVGRVYGLEDPAPTPGEVKRLVAEKRRQANRLVERAKPILHRIEELQRAFEESRGFYGDGVNGPEASRWYRDRQSDLKESRNGLVRFAGMVSDIFERESWIARPVPPVEYDARTLTFIWWHFLLPSYPGHWSDKQRLAGVWGFPFGGTASFRRAVLRLLQGVTEIPSCPGAPPL